MSACRRRFAISSYSPSYSSEGRSRAGASDDAEFDQGPGGAARRRLGWTTFSAASARSAASQRSATFDALAWAEAGMDFADALHLTEARDAKAFISFDRDLAKEAAKFGAPPIGAP